MVQANSHCCRLFHLLKLEKRNIKENKVPILSVSGMINYKSVFKSISTKKINFFHRESDSVNQSSVHLKMYQLSHEGDSLDHSFLILQTLLRLSVDAFLPGYP